MATNAERMATILATLQGHQTTLNTVLGNVGQASTDLDSSKSGAVTSSQLTTLETTIGTLDKIVGDLNTAVTDLGSKVQ